jgi:hypothetical protein
MAFSVLTVSTITFLFVLYYGAEAAIANEVTNYIGAIIDVNSRIGKEEKIGMQIAVQNFNKNSNSTHKLSLYIREPHRITSVG